MRIEDDALEFLATISDGDAHRALSALEVGVLSSNERPLIFTRTLAEESVQRKAVAYDRTGDSHYDAASALIKSVRGSDADAACTGWRRCSRRARTSAFSARRIVILASEDIGNADPHASPWRWPRCKPPSSLGCPNASCRLRRRTSLACAPKSNAATIGIAEARADVKRVGCCRCRCI